MRFKLEVEFEMESMPHTYSLPVKLAEAFLRKRGGEVEFINITMKRLTASGNDVLETIMARGEQP